MILEIAYISIREGSAEAFEQAIADAAIVFRQARGCRSFALSRVIEDPLQFRLLVGWDTVEDHMVSFRNSPAFAEWRALAGPFFAAPPRVEHFETVLQGF